MVHRLFLFYMRNDFGLNQYVICCERRNTINCKNHISCGITTVLDIECDYCTSYSVVHSIRDNG